jgi:hypothetical protein
MHKYNEHISSVSKGSRAVIRQSQPRLFDENLVEAAHDYEYQISEHAYTHAHLAAMQGAFR